MWRQFYDYTRQLLAMKAQTNKNTEDIKEIRQELKQLTSVVQQLVYELHRMDDAMTHERENQAHEREKMALRLENILLRSERGMPPLAPATEQVEHQAGKVEPPRE